MRATTFVLLAAIAAHGAGQEPRVPVSDAEYDALRAQVVPDAAEAWQAIPWRIDLAAARREAAERGVPLFLWTMNGHPLGCT